MASSCGRLPCSPHWLLEDTPKKHTRQVNAGCSPRRRSCGYVLAPVPVRGATSAIPLTRGPQSHSQRTVEQQQQPPPPRGPGAVSPQALLLCRSSQPLGEEAAGRPPSRL